MQRDKTQLKSAGSRGSSGVEEKEPFVFDPMENYHLWTMWRIGNTEKIVNFAKYKTMNNKKNDVVQYGFFSGVPSGSPTILVPPLAEHIKFTDNTFERASNLMHPPEIDPPSGLKTGQFIYYGLPRIVLRDQGNPYPSLQRK